MTVSGGHFAHVGEVILTRRNYYGLIANAGDSVSNGQRWVAKVIDTDVSIRSPPARRYKRHSVVVFYIPAWTCAAELCRHGSVCPRCNRRRGARGRRSRTDDRAGVHIPLTRGRGGNYLYMAGDSGTGRGTNTPAERREVADCARALLV